MLDSTTPEVHKRDLPVAEPEKPMDYDSWLRAQQEGKLKQGRRRAKIRDQGDRDSALGRQRLAAAAEEERMLEEQQRIADARSAALETILAHARTEARKRAATFNASMAAAPRTTAADELAEGTDAADVGADVLAYRPATSHTAIRRDRQQHSEHLRRQAELRREMEQVKLHEEKEVSRDGAEEGSVIADERTQRKRETKEQNGSERAMDAVQGTRRRNGDTMDRG